VPAPQSPFTAKTKTGGDDARVGDGAGGVEAGVLEVTEAGLFAVHEASARSATATS